MKTNLNLALFVGACSLIMAGCGSKTGEGITLDDCPVVAERVPLKNGTDSLIVVDYNKFDFDHPIDFPLSEFCDYELVKLENSSKEMMVGPGRFYVFGNYMAWRDPYGRRVLVFDRQGNYIRTFNDSGGPEGFEGFCSSIYIDEENDQMYAILLRKTKVYNIKTGDYLRSIDHEKELRLPLMTAMLDKLLYVQAPGQMEYLNKDAIWQTDKEGNQVKSIPSSYFWDMNLVDHQYIEDFWMSSFPLIKPSGEDYLLFSLNNRYAICDTTYHYYPSTNRLVPATTMKNPYTENGGLYTQEETPTYYTAYFTEMNTGPLQLDGYIDRITKRVMVDKKTLKGSAVHLCLDKFGMIDITAEYAQTFSGDFALNLSPDRLQQLIEERLSKDGLDDNEQMKLRTLYDSIDPDDNNYVIVGKLK